MAAHTTSETLHDNLVFQAEILQEVSKTYAMAIPLLPEQLRDVVGNAYLLCRIADSIEDDRLMPFDQKRVYLEQFTAIVSGRESAKPFASELSGSLSQFTPESERKLVANTEQVIRITLSFNTRQRQALERCINIMSKGMLEFQQCKNPVGLNDLPHLDRYCYFVAGVVGELLTELFCAYSNEIDTRYEEMLNLSVSYGKGLQMTNILKDIWDDKREGTCWLPQDVFLESGFDLKSLTAGQANPGFADGLFKLIAIARHHLKNALKFALIVPRDEIRLRRHLIAVLGLSTLTLRKIYLSDTFKHGQDIKLSQSSVRITIAILNSLLCSNTALRAFFYILTRRLPHITPEQAITA